MTTKTTSDASRRHFMLQALVIFGGTFGYSLMKRWRKFLLLAAACVFVGYVTVFVVQRGYYSAQTKHNQNTVPSLVSNAGPLARDILEEDRKFLDDLGRKQNQDDVPDGNPPSAASQNIGKAGMIVSGNEPVPKAELVINSEIVKRGELVVHSRTIKRAELVQPRHQ